MNGWFNGVRTLLIFVHLVGAKKKEFLWRWLSIVCHRTRNFYMEKPCLEWMNMPRNDFEFAYLSPNSIHPVPPCVHCYCINWVESSQSPSQNELIAKITQAVPNLAIHSKCCSIHLWRFVTIIKSRCRFSWLQDTNESNRSLLVSLEKNKKQVFARAF